MVLAAVSASDKVCFYTEYHYGGTSLCGSVGERVDLYFDHGEFNDRFKSVKMPIGLQVVAFFDDSFHGYHKVFKKNESDLNAFSNQISSFIVQPATVCFYPYTNYQGTAHCTPVGNMVDLSGNSNDNSYQSVSVAPGLMVKVFTDGSFEGRLTWFTADTHDLGDFKNVITSFVAEYSNEVCFYTEKNYQGEQLCAKAGENIDVWISNYHFNDKFSSVRVPYDLFTTVYVTDGFHGWYRTFTGDASDLSDFDNDISSFVVGFNGDACFYTTSNFGGDRFCSSYGSKIDVAVSIVKKTLCLQ